MSLQSVLNMISSGSAQIEQGKKTVSGVYADQQSSLNNIMGSTQAASTAQGIIDMQAANAALSAQNNARKAATAMGANMDATNEIVTQISNSFREASLRASQQAAKISQYKSADGLIGSLAGGIFDMLYDGEEQAKLQAFNNEVQTNAGILQNMNTNIIGITNAQNAISEVHTTATMAALQEKISAESAKELERLRMESGNIKIQEVNQLMQMTGQQINLAAQGENMRAAAEQRAMAAEQRKYMQQEREEMSKLRKMDLEDRIDARAEARKLKQDALESEKMTLNYYNQGVVVSGVKDAVQLNSFKELKQLLELKDRRALDFIKIGLRSTATGVDSVAADAYDFRRFARENPAALNKAQQTIASTLETYAAEAISNESIARFLQLDYSNMQQKAEASKAITDARKDKDLMEQLQRSYLNGKLDPSAPIIPGDTQNPYRIMDFESFKDAAFMDENGFLKTLKPLAEAGDAANGKPIIFDPSEVISLGVKAIQEGTPLTEVSDGISTYVRASMLLSNKTYDFQRMGLPEQQQANVTVSWKRPTSGAFAGSTKEARVVDLSDPLEVTSVLNAVMAGQRNHKFTNPAIEFLSRSIISSLTGTQ